MRVEFYGCLAARPCASPVGIQSGKIRNTAMTASSTVNAYLGPYRARLHISGSGRFKGAWVPKIRNSNQWLQITFGRPMKITGIATQGRADAKQFVTRYLVAFSQDNVHFEYYMEYGNFKYFQANSDRFSVKDNSFSPPIKCSYFRVLPKGWYSTIALRLELYGCPENRCSMPLGVADRRIPNPLMTASSYHSFYCGPWNARLHQRRVSRLGGSWCARTNNQRQWLQIDFEALASITGVATQGRYDADQWVKSYKITFSKDGSNYYYYKERGVVKLYGGNSDRYIVVTHTFNRRIIARFIRLHPVSYHGWMSMRVEFYGCIIGPRCNRPIGIENGKIRGTQISASSEADSNHAAQLGRLNQKPSGKKIGAWAAGSVSAYQWLQIDLKIPMKLTSVTTQGRNDNTNQWVTRYLIEYSLDGAHFTTYWSQGNVYYFPGNRNRDGIVMHRLFPMPRARILRFLPKNWHRWISMRVELNGCPSGRCSLPLGLEDKRILDGALSASSFANHNLAPWLGRINSIRSWSSRVNNARQWLQIYLGNLARLTGIATQGRRDAHQWVTRYVLSYGNGMSFKAYREKRKIRMFRGNSDRNTIVSYTLLAPFTAQYVRFHPKAWRSHISMRVELYGCQKELTRLCSYPLGIQSGGVKDAQITASSIWDKYHQPYFGRLKRVRRGRNMGGWAARHNNQNQWIQFDLRRILKITMVSTQGRKIVKQWVTRYTISHSIDCVHFVPYKEKDRLKYFTGNYDGVSVVTRTLTPPIVTRCVRIHPRGWYRHISFRAELHGCTPERCDIPLGMEDGRLPDVALTASSIYHTNYAAYQGRLNSMRSGAKFGSWIAKHNNKHQWFQVDLGNRAIIIKCATQGRYDANQWVSSYTIRYGMNGFHFKIYKEGGRTRVFQGNSERQIIVMNRFLSPIRARFVRLYPRTWYGHISMRMELYGCSRGHMCNRPLGMMSGVITNTAITASSMLDKYRAPFLARLNGRRMGKYYGAWFARHNNRYQWLQIDLGRLCKIIRVGTQGSALSNYWVTTYYLSSSVDGIHFAKYRQNSRDKYFPGNRDRTTVVYNSVIPSIRARFLRFHPWSWRSHIAMRVEVFGCALGACGAPLGFEDGRLPKYNFKASSMWDARHGPWRARLNLLNSGGSGGWIPRSSNVFQYMQVDLGQISRIVAVATQGRYEANQWVKKYEISYSKGGSKFTFYSIKKKVQMFPGNSDRYTVVFNRLYPSFRGRYVRFYPKQWHSFIAMRIELYGCNQAMFRMCFRPLGMQSNHIPNSTITASSQWDKSLTPARARLNVKRVGSLGGAWCVKRNDHNQYLQIDLRKPTRITKVITQGRYDANQFVRNYYLYYSQNGRTFLPIKEGGKVKLMKGNFDRFSLVEQPIDPPVNGRYLRFNPRSWHSHICMRVEVYGCTTDYPVISRPVIRPVMRRGRSCSRIALRCNFNIRGRRKTSTLTRVEWFVNKKVTKVETVRGTHAELMENTYGFKAGTTVSCRAKTRYTNGKDWTMYQSSKDFFAGIKVHPKSLRMTDSSDWKIVRLSTLIPIRSHVNRHPSVVVNLDDHDEFVTDKCSLSLTERNRRNFGFYIKPIRDFKKIKNQKIQVWFRPIKSTPGLCGFWKGYRLPSIKVITTNRGVKKCHGTGDPHYRTFDGKYYDILRNAGTYVMTKSTRRNFEVQARIWPCWRVVCNCGVAIRENNDVVTIDMCHGPWRRTSPRVVQKSRAPLGNRMKIRRYGSGQSTRFKVMMRSGAIVEAHCQYWGMSLYLTVPGIDSGATVGLCGNNNGNAADDLERKGIYTFARKYMLKPGTTLFEKLPPRISTVRRRVRPSCSCVKKGNRRFNTCDVKPLPDTDK
ncbi:uncharacterized protein, partial [Montipora capricornis]|uniref:uncharacterized protein n=1 Tax=Montipora capricornis TaxID=246305 RepID=UPI0035F12640